MPPLLYLLTVGNLVVGSSAFVISGLVAEIAAGLGVSVGVAGLAMTAYALAVALCAPLLVVWTGRWPRRRALLLALALFTAGNALCAVAGSIAPFYAGRVLMGLGSVFTPLSAGLAIALVAPERRGQALSTVFLGMSLSYVIGLPLGTFIGLREGWQAAVWTMTAASALMFVLAAWRVPAQVQAPGADFTGVGALLRRRDVLAVLLTTLLYFTAVFTVFSYIGPVLAALVPSGGLPLAGTLALFGLAGVAGTLFGGLAADRFGAATTMRVLLAGLAGTMMLLPLTAGSYPLMLAVLLAWGCVGFGLMSPQQSRLAGMAPTQAPMLMSLNTSMLYCGTALGAAVGGPMAALVGFERLSWLAAPFALAAWAVLVLSAGSRGTGLARPQIDPN